MKRRDFIKSGALITPLAATTARASPGQPLGTMLTRAIPSSGEQLPVVGLGTWQTFDVGQESSQRDELSKVLAELVKGGGSVVDSSPMYGRSERVVGDLAAQLGLNQKLFKATKVWTSGAQQGIEQMRSSMRKMQTSKMDLMQVHNLLDAETHLQTLTKWKEQGIVRYVGITHYHSGGYAEMSRLMKRYDLDFIQINYSLLSREIEQSILPIAGDRNIAVLINRPFEGGNLFRKVRGTPLPEFAREFDCLTWGQYFLKFIIAHPAVTCVIPGTSKLKHLRDNLQAGRGKLPTANHRKKMIELLA